MILLPPSEGKAIGGVCAARADWAQAFPELDADRAAVRDAVRGTIGGGEAVAGRLLGVGGHHLARALADWNDLDEAPTMPAAERYTGVVWTALDPRSLERAARRRLDRRVLIPSGLWGIVAATDPIPAYRLKMSARATPIGALSAFWRPRITPLVARSAAAGWVIDLLPAEHAAAIDPSALGSARLLRVDLLDEGPHGARRAVGHAGKSLKGRLARAILEADVRGPRDLAALAVPGLRLGHRPMLSIPREGPVVVSFVRTYPGGRGSGPRIPRGRSAA